MNVILITSCPKLVGLDLDLPDDETACKVLQPCLSFLASFGSLLRENLGLIGGFSLAQGQDRPHGIRPFNDKRVWSFDCDRSPRPGSGSHSRGRRGAGGRAGRLDRRCQRNCFLGWLRWRCHWLFGRRSTLGGLDGFDRYLGGLDNSRKHWWGLYGLRRGYRDGLWWCYRCDSLFRRSDRGIWGVDLDSGPAILGSEPNASDRLFLSRDLKDI